jgi:dTDP-4-amino-4,6-dideoxygalactose transaminase
MARRLENRFPNLDVTDFASLARSLELLELSGSAKIVGEFERALAAKFGRATAVTLCSGTVSIYAALWALGIGKGDEVIVPPTAPIMSALPVLQIGATPVYADVTVRPGFGFDPSELKAAITSRTRAVLAVPLWGYPIDMDAISDVTRRSGVPLLEDVAQAHGSTWKGRYLGTFGDAGCFSTHERKLITTGEGGFVLTDRQDIAAAARILVRYGIENDIGGVKLGANYKLGAVPAALGLSQLAKLDAKLAGRKRVGDQIRTELSRLGWLNEFEVEPSSVHNGYSLVYEVTDPKINVWAMSEWLAKEGVVSDTWRYRYKPMYEMPLFQPYAKPCANAERIIPRTITFPCHEGLSAEDIEFMVDRIMAAPNVGI